MKRWIKYILVAAAALFVIGLIIPERYQMPCGTSVVLVASLDPWREWFSASWSGYLRKGRDRSAAFCRRYGALQRLVR